MNLPGHPLDIQGTVGLNESCMGGPIDADVHVALDEAGALAEAKVDGAEGDESVEEDGESAEMDEEDRPAAFARLSLEHEDLGNLGTPNMHGHFLVHIEGLRNDGELRVRQVCHTACLDLP